MLVEAIVIVLIFYIIYLWIYPHYLSPLRHIPDPDGLPILGHTLEFLLSHQDDELVFQKFCKKFEKFGMHRFRHIIYGIDVVVVLNPQWIKHVLSRPSEFKKDDVLLNFFPLLNKGILASIGEHHRFQKKILAKAFNADYVKHYIPVFDRHTQILLKVLNKRLSENRQESVNLGVKPYSKNFSFDIIAEIAFGYPANSQITSANPFVIALKDEMEMFLNTRNRFVKKYFPTAFSDKYRSSSEDVLNQVLQRRKDKIINGTLTDVEKHDLLSIMINGKDEKTGQAFSDQLIKDNCFTFMLAGFETTATAIPITLYNLAMYPEMQERCRKEILTVINGKKSEELNIEDFDWIPYTMAFIKESMRFLVTIPKLFRVSTKDCKLGDYEIPKGTRVFLNLSNINRDPSAFDYPDEFIPERFMEGSSLKAGSTLSFGFGPYSCIGKNFALHEIKVSIFRILQHFKLTVDPAFVQMHRRQYITTVFKPEIHIRLHKVDDN